MAKRLPTILAPKDSPIYSGRFVVSSMKYRRKENGINKSNMGNERRTAAKSGNGPYNCENVENRIPFAMIGTMSTFALKPPRRCFNS